MTERVDGDRREALPSDDQVRSAPKVLLHDHLDGGLRPRTVIELARAQGCTALPTTDEAALRRWFERGASRHDLALYLETFAHTVAVMQTADALERVAAECAEDLAADGVVYAEVRFAPELHVRGGLSLDEVVAAVVRGFALGSQDRAIRIGTLCTAMRTGPHSTEIAELAARWRDRGVVGFDLAGAEKGHRATRHLAAFEVCRRNGVHVTVHAGEAFGPPSIWEAIEQCGAERIGHGVRIRDDIHLAGAGVAGARQHRLGRVAADVRDRCIPLEICPSSNVHTGVCVTIDDHPVKLLADLGFRVTINTDNRLMSACSMSSELLALRDSFGWGLDEFRRFSVDAMHSAFVPLDERRELVERVITPGYDALARSGGA